MKKFFLLNLIFCQIIARQFNENYILRSLQKCDYDWTIIGAGPAGIVTAGMLLDLGVEPNRIMWIDPEFNAGRLSTYSTVQANTKSKLFLSFLQACNSFQECAAQSIDELKKLDLEKEYELEKIASPLKHLSACLCQKVNSIKGHMQALHFENNAWQVKANGNAFSSFNVVLAHGSHPKSLNYSQYQQKEIPLDIALNKNILKNYVTSQDIVAVVGSAHSAFLVVKYLMELQVKKVINFYSQPIEYLIEINDDVALNINGLKGATAQWVKEIIEKNPPDNLIRLESEPEYLDKVLPACTKIIYAIGFERNELPAINEAPKLQYDSTTGIIATRLFGIGIAFPELYAEPNGKIQQQVGLGSFIGYAKKVIPFWLQQRTSKKNIKNLRSFADLFNIEIL